MHIRWIGQLLVLFAFGLIVWNLLVSEFGKWTVRGWFGDLSPVDVMFIVAVGLVAMMIFGSRQPPSSGQSANCTRTVW